nr:hypothetical protein [Saprospiraceae bacterium]
MISNCSLFFRLFCVAVTLVLFPFIVRAEVPSDTTVHNHRLSLDFKSLSFFKNNEYSNPFTRGFTGIGYYVQTGPRLELSERTSVMAGMHVLHFSGREKYSEVIPLFTLEYQLHRDWTLIMGSIRGSIAHKLTEPLFRYDRYYQKPVEYGLQFLLDKEWIQSDIWLNWTEFITEGDPFQEEFYVGKVTRFQLWASENISISIPFELLIFHKGGQIDTSDDPTISSYNISAGVSTTYAFNERWALSFVPRYYRFIGDERVQTYDRGHAYYLKLKLSHERWNFMVGYWAADQFNAPGGEHLFLSVSEKPTPFSQKKRELITGKMNYQTNIYKGVELSTGTEVYYDPMIKSLDFSFRLMIVIDQNFFITRLKGDRLE